jgi:putative two-component system response regulator
MRILVADDDRLSTELLRRTLLHEGFEVVTAPDGAKALESMTSGDFRVLICDWEMPGLTGPELCRRVRQQERGYTYVIMLTSRSGASHMADALAAGADEFLSKPVDTGELLVRVRTGMRLISLESREMALFALAKLAESRDNETGAHLERVRGYARVLAQQIAGMEKFRKQVPESYVPLIYQTSPLHDIGKVGIPDSVLLKPGRLSDREFEIMKMHTTIGAQTLEAALKQFPGVKFLEMARDITISHHERFDGTGYPHGLKGEAIPLAGRIVALADVYDALTSKRVYKGTFTHDVAKSIMLQETGSHFDPSIIEAFLACEAQFIAIRDRYSEPRGVAA